jgi:hypothetical protein
MSEAVFIRVQQKIKKFSQNFISRRRSAEENQEISGCWTLHAKLKMFGKLQQVVLMYNFIQNYMQIQINGMKSYADAFHVCYLVPVLHRLNKKNPGRSVEIQKETKKYYFLKHFRRIWNIKRIYIQ